MSRVLNLSRDDISSRSATPSVLTPVLDFLHRHAPFDRMAPQPIEFLAMRLRIGFYSAGEAVVSPDLGPANTFYIIKQGRVRGEVSDTGGRVERGAWELVPGECFPVGALLRRRPVRTVHRAVEDTFCYELEREDFEWLLTHSRVFHDFCSRRLANLLDEALAQVQAKMTREVTVDSSLNAPLRKLVRRTPVTCPPSTPLRDAAGAMHAAHVGSIIVTDKAAQPLGIFTLHDLLGRVVAPGVELNVPIERVMTPNPAALPPQAPAHEAAEIMTRHGFSHLCVVDGGRLVGVISERDLFALQRTGLVSLSRAITHARNLVTLARLAGDVHPLVDRMLVQGASVPQLTQLVSVLNDHLTQRAIAICIAEQAGDVPFVWLAFGSEGRQEQTLKTDQDNGMLFLAEDRDADRKREQLLPLAQRINQALAHIGFSLCPGNVMASNPECCLSLKEWRARFEQWIDQGRSEHLLKASLFFDFRPLYGDPGPAESLRGWLTRAVALNQRFLRQMAENALRNQPPLGLMRDFVVETEGEHAHTIDLKRRGTTPFVDGARLLALAHGISRTDTVGRLHAAAEAKVIQRDEAEAWSDAYAYLQLLRMRRHREQEERGFVPDNHINPDALNELERRILKESFRQARKLQTRIAMDYQL